MRAICHCALLAISLCACSTPKISDQIVSTEIIRSTTSWNGQPLPSYSQGTPEITILRITIPPGMTVPMHSHPVINAGVLLKGELSVFTDSGDTLQLKEGDPIIEVVETWHTGINEGTKPAEIMVFYAGVTDMPLSVAKPEPCTDEWTEFVEQQVSTDDGQGHGPDTGSDEWKSVIEFRLGVRGNMSIPARDTRAWCEYIDSLIKAN